MAACGCMESKGLLRRIRPWPVGKRDMGARECMHALAARARVWGWNVCNKESSLEGNSPEIYSVFAKLICFFVCNSKSSSHA